VPYSVLPIEGQTSRQAGTSAAHKIDLDCTSADMLVRDCKPGVHTTIEVADSNAMRGDMIGLDTSPPPWHHIANVASIDVNQNNEIIVLVIYEAAGNVGGMPEPQGLVRKVNGITYYINFGYQFKFARWNYE